MLNQMRIALLTLSTVGALSFAGLLIGLLRDPAAFETKIRSFAVAEVKTKAVDFAQERGLNLDSAGDASDSRLGQLAERMTERSDQITDLIEARVDEVVADVLANACSLDCEGREAIRSGVRDILERRQARYLGGAATLRNFALGRYDRTVRGLHRSLVIVCLSNLIVFGGIITLTFFRPQFMPALVKIGGLAFVSVVVMSLWYVVGQDWISAILFNDFVGWGYAVFMGALFLALLDVALNRARVLATFMNVAGSVTVVPVC